MTTIVYVRYFNDTLRVNRPWGVVIGSVQAQAVRLRRIRAQAAACGSKLKPFCDCFVAWSCQNG